MKTAKLTPKKDTHAKYERLQKLYLFTLIKLYATKPQHHEFSLNGLRVAIKRLQDFWQQQKVSWAEIRDISDDEVEYISYIETKCPSPDHFFEQDLLPSAKNSLATIIEHEEEEQHQDNLMQKEVDTLWRVVNRLKEAENRILERYKYELKTLALDLKTSNEKSKSLQEENEEFQQQLKDLRTQIEQDEFDAESYRKTLPSQNKIKTSQTLPSRKSHNQNLSISDQIDRSIQTDDNDDADDKEYYQMLYENEREKLSQYERKFENLRKQYMGLQEQFQKSKLDLEQSQLLDQDERFMNASYMISLEDQFRQELAIELASLKNKIQVLTDQANQAETMLLERDQEVKDSYKTNQHIQQELTQKRALCSVALEEKKSLEANVKVLQNVNKKIEQENVRLIGALNMKEQQTKQQDLNEKKEEKQLRQQAAKQIKDSTYKSFSSEIQQLSEENYELQSQLKSSQRQLKDVLDSSRSHKTSEVTQLQIAAQEIENLRSRLFEQSRIIFEYERKGESVDQDYVEYGITKYKVNSQKIDESLNEAMEYLELKDKEIDKLRTENDSLRYQVLYLDKHKQHRASYQQSPMKSEVKHEQKLPHPHDLNQVKDLQNLLMVMSKSLSEKEEQLKRYQR